MKRNGNVNRALKLKIKNAPWQKAGDRLAKELEFCGAVIWVERDKDPRRPWYWSVFSKEVVTRIDSPKTGITFPIYQAGREVQLGEAKRAVNQSIFRLALELTGKGEDARKTIRDHVDPGRSRPG